MDDIRHLLPAVLKSKAEYVFREFPKWVETPTGRVVVRDAEEESRVCGSQPLEPQIVTAPRRGRPPKAPIE